MAISREIFDLQRRPRFGDANPERMKLAFWEWMIRGDDAAPPDGPLSELGLMMREGYLRGIRGPWRVRDLFKIPINRDDGPIWTFDRMGATRTELPDGRLVCVGGEHEDYYDPDFHIYNDVVVLGPTDEIEIFGYPRDVFPPTDFHTATLVDDRIILIGGLGRPEQQLPGHTPDFALDLADFHIEEIETTGQLPGWISRHSARRDEDGNILIEGGEVYLDASAPLLRNVEVYALNPRLAVWQRLTERHWPQFVICQENRGLFEESPAARAILPASLQYEVLELEDWSARILVDGVPVCVNVDVAEVRILVEGDLHADLCLRTVEGIRGKIEALYKFRCVTHWTGGV